MKLISLMVVTMLFLSCAELDKDVPVSPYDIYHRYLTVLLNNDYDTAVDMMSLNNKHRYIDQKGQDSFDSFFPFFSSIDSVVVNEFSYFQMHLKDKACLTVNGVDEKGEPTTLNFEMLYENHTWKLNYVQMMYHDTQQQFPKVATCPAKP